MTDIHEGPLGGRFMGVASIEAEEAVVSSLF